ncbi:hypothetical protein J1N10_08090 [Carboxylicivirga sp. A043]|uniref:hypothetical protein n=1 Tax=Carboxylicivirga litoralis TaxID=2816963 RepID=UPI0021CB0A0C|nr:hypothetical protein [Carboxylicivirga sp. A043]MCU4155933.1 hypothetical protein [Carboxylicivirga sp. A043]
MKTSLIFLVLLLPFAIDAQDYLASPEFNKFWRDVEQSHFIEGKEEANYSGTPYLFESNFSSILLQDGHIIDSLTIRYNVYNDRMEIKKGENFYAIPKEKLFPHIVLEDRHFYLKIFKETSKRQIGYFESIVNDSLCSLYLRHNVFLQEASEPKPFQDAKPATFKSKPADLFITFDAEVLLLIKNKNDFLDITPDHQKELAAFIKTNKIKFKKPESVKLLVEYYNAL